MGELKAQAEMWWYLMDLKKEASGPVTKHHDSASFLP
jgi:hypothetical protein